MTFLGADICAFDRTKILAGTASAAQLCKMTPNTEGGYLPSDIDGPTAPTDAPVVLAAAVLPDPDVVVDG